MKTLTRMLCGVGGLAIIMTVADPFVVKGVAAPKKKGPDDVFVVNTHEEPVPVAGEGMPRKADLRRF